MSDAALVATDVRKSFGAEGVVDGVDLELRDEEILVLLGPNGAGKTVLLSCLAGSKRPSDGEVEVLGRQLAEDRGHNLAYMQQGTIATETLTGRENVDFFSRLHPRFTDRWEETVASLSLTDDLDKLVGDYSAGMCRKLELALVLSVDVPIYLLDEPTAGVDLSMVGRFHDVILDRYEAGSSFLITSHRPMDAELADRIAYIPDGTITAVGEPEALLADVPPVIRVTGTDAIREAEPFVRDGRLFPQAAEARGFLRPDASVEEVAAAVGTDHVEAIQPTHADAFNYYVHVRGER